MRKPQPALIALGDPTRQEIIAILAKGPAPVNQIAEKLPVSRPAVSKHLRILVDARLVDCQSQGTRRIYRLREEGLESVRDYLDGLWSRALARFQLVAENTKKEKP
jgi:DNA-binding transcriptional ArsR family regulator